MLVPRNATSCSTGAHSASPRTDSIQAGDGLEDRGLETCSCSMTVGTLPRQSKETQPQFSEGPWTLILFSTNKPLPADFDLDGELRAASITISMVPNIVQLKNRGSFELVVATLCLDLLSKKFQDFQITVDHNPFKPTESDIRIHGHCEATRRAQVNSLNTAAEASRRGWGCGPAERYGNAAEMAGLGTALKRAVLNWDVQESNPQVLETFTRNLLFLCLNLFDDYETPAVLNLLERDQSDWLEPFRNDHRSLYERSTAAGTSVGIQKSSEQQTISLFRILLEFSGGQVDCRQHVFGVEYTISQNATLCARLLGFSCTRHFGDFDPIEMRSALLKSSLFTGGLDLSAHDILEWSLRLMDAVPVGFPDNHLGLPSHLLRGIGAQQIYQLEFHLEHFYRQVPRLRKVKNNILLLLSWSSMYRGQTLDVLKDWAKSDESFCLYQSLIEDLWGPQTMEAFALTLAALLCRERLLLDAIDGAAPTIGASHLTDLDAIFNGEVLSNMQTIFEQMILSLMRVLYTLKESVLYTLKESKDMVEFLTEVLATASSLLGSLDGVWDQYCVRKIRGHDHNSAFATAMETLSEAVDTSEELRNW